MPLKMGVSRDCNDMSASDLYSLLFQHSVPHEGSIYDCIVILLQYGDHTTFLKSVPWFFALT